MSVVVSQRKYSHSIIHQRNEITKYRILTNQNSKRRNRYIVTFFKARLDNDSDTARNGARMQEGNQIGFGKGKGEGRSRCRKWQLREICRKGEFGGPAFLSRSKLGLLSSFQQTLAILIPQRKPRSPIKVTRKSGSLLFQTCPVLWRKTRPNRKNAIHLVQR